MSYADKLEIERFVDATEITKFVYTEKNAALVKGHDLVKLSTFVLKTPPYFLDDLFRRGFDYSNFWNQALNAVKFEVGWRSRFSIMRAILGACNLGNSSETKINLHDVLGDTSDHNWRESSYNAAFTHLGKRAEEIRIETARETARYLLDQLTPTGKLIPQLPSPFLARKLGIVNNTVFNIDYVFKTRLPNVEAHLKYTGAHYPTAEIVVKPLS